MHLMIQGECEKCEDRGEIHGPRCIVRKLIFDRDFKDMRPHVTREDALDAAVHALDQYIKIEREKQVNQIQSTQTTEMSLSIKLGITESQLDLVKRTVAKNATPDELELFFYRCKELQLNPLMPGQVYFLKFGNNPGTVVVGLDGFRARAQRTGQLSGIKRGVIRNDKGECIGGWADVYRKDWTQPAHEEVPLSEYFDARKQTWKSMPETMIKKVAEVAALRMAFPEELGGVYSKEEMDQADRTDTTVRHVETHQSTNLKPSQPQLKRLFAIAGSHGISNDELRDILLNDYGHESSKDLSIDEYNKLCDTLQAKTPITIEKKIDVNQPVDFNGPEITETDLLVEETKTMPKVDTNEVPWAKYRSDARIVK